MAIEGITQPEFIQIDEQLRLRKYDGHHDFAFDWYQDIETVKLVDGVEEPYSWGKLNGMYGYLNNHGELYFIEILEGQEYLPTMPFGSANLTASFPKFASFACHT